MKFKEHKIQWIITILAMPYVVFQIVWGVMLFVPISPIFTFIMIVGFAYAILALGVFIGKIIGN